MIALHPYGLDSIHPRDRHLVGDKALYLALALQQNYPVRPGIVIPANALPACLQHTAWAYPFLVDLADSSLQFEDYNPRQVQAVARHLRQIVRDLQLPTSALQTVLEAIAPWSASALILRPSLVGLESGEVAGSGLLDSHCCLVHPGAIAHALKRTWSELFRARSLIFWNQRGISLHEVHLAVLVQPLEDAIASGTLTLQDRHVHLQATWGLGMAIVRGEVTPDEYTGALDPISQPEVVQWKAHIRPKRYQVQLPALASQPQGSAGAGKTTASFLNSSGDPALTDLQLDYAPVALDRQTQPVLNAAALAQVQHLAQRLRTDFSTPLQIEWTWPRCAGTDFDSQPDIQFVQVTALSTAIPTSESALLLDASEIPSDTWVGLAAAQGQITAAAWVVSTSSDTPQENMPLGSILVAPIITPEWLPWLHRASGIVTEQGGMTSHGALLARELGIPAVVGVAQITRHLQTGDRLILEGDRGRVRRANSATGDLENPVGDDSRRAPNSGSRFASAPGSVLPLHSIPVLGSSPLTVPQLLVNVGQMASPSEIAALPVAGVGLLRSEFLLHDRLADYLQSQSGDDRVPQEIAQRLQPLAQAFYPRPIFYRTLDLRSHERPGDRPSELNPILGMHGTLSYQQDSRLFDLELKAIAQLHQAGLTNVHLLLPFVRTVEEFRFCQQRLARHNFPTAPSLQVWIMAEVPAVIFSLPDFAQAGVNGISIGSNDLTQLLLGVDRDQAEMAIAYNPLHPSVLAALQQLIQTARRLGLPCSICGLAPSQFPELVTRLVQWGITSISVSPDAITATQEAIAQAAPFSPPNTALQNSADRTI
jgi:pyruvate,water dikinase